MHGSMNIKSRLFRFLRRQRQFSSSAITIHIFTFQTAHEEACILHTVVWQPSC